MFQAGCVHFTAMASGMCDIKVLILLYTAEKKAYLGFIPNNQTAFVERLRRVIQQQKQSQVLMRQGQVGYIVYALFYFTDNLFILKIILGAPRFTR